MLPCVQSTVGPSTAAAKAEHRGRIGVLAKHVVPLDGQRQRVRQRRHRLDTTQRRARRYATDAVESEVLDQTIRLPLAFRGDRPIVIVAAPILPGSAFACRTTYSGVSSASAARSVSMSRG